MVNIAAHCGAARTGFWPNSGIDRCAFSGGCGFSASAEHQMLGSTLSEQYVD
jgi:hypothetical protein